MGTWGQLSTAARDSVVEGGMGSLAQRHTAGQRGPGLPALRELPAHGRPLLPGAPVCAPQRWCEPLLGKEDTLIPSCPSQDSIRNITKNP